MTTAMWDGETLYADSRTTFENRERRCSADGVSKIITFEKGDYIPWKDEERIVMIAVSGNASTAEYLVEEVIKRGARIHQLADMFRPLRPVFKEDKKGSLLVVTTAHVVKIAFPYSKDLALSIGVNKQTKPAFLGTGAEYARVGKVCFGLPSSDAMVMARAFDSYSGGNILAKSLGPNGTVIDHLPIEYVSRAHDFNRVQEAISYLPRRRAAFFDPSLYQTNSLFRQLAKQRSKDSKPRVRVPIEMMLPPTEGNHP